MDGIHPKNLSAQLAYRGVGNPPSAHPTSAISNAFPGLEMDFRNIWRRIFIGIELHEANNLVVSVDEGVDDQVSQLANGYLLVSADGQPVEVPVFGPLYTGAKAEPLPDTTYKETTMPIEWSNALASIVQKAGQEVRCVFRPVKDGREIEVYLTVRSFFVEAQAAIAQEMALPGELSQSLCSPWQNDYRECACFYWAASRPDFVNVEPRPDGSSAGHNWMQRDRTATTPKVYVTDTSIADRNDPRLVSYEDLFRDWEKMLRFEIGGKDAE